ncbi:MAG TPA: YciI family protein [Myxococcota bacterium]|jgi:hypothetical protein|nr:YciI family protein [Myxococcota bacterium]
MQFLLMINGDESARANMSKDELGKVFEQYMAYTKMLKDGGHFVAGDALQPEATGARVRVRGGKRTVVDGPFAETKEVLGGYYLVNCETKEQAIELAAKCPGAAHGTMEVRPVVQY